MIKDAKNKKGGGKLARSETVSVRLDPKLRYFAELASRRHRRTLSSFIEWAVEETLKKEIINNDAYGNSVSLYDEMKPLWDLDEVERFLKLAQRYPDLLTHDEQWLWKLIQDTSVYSESSKTIISFKLSKGTLDMLLINFCWAELNGVVEGSSSIEALKAAMCAHSDIPF